MSDLNDMLRQLGTLSVPSEKAEITLDGNYGADSFWVNVRHHLPDGSYTDAETYKYTLDDK